MDRMQVISLFGEQGKSCIPVLDEICNSFGKTTYTYTFIDENKFLEILRRDTPASMKIYWSEILLRVHLGAATSLMRQERWISGMIDSAVNENFFSFSACLRGFIESSADVNDALMLVAITLAEHFSSIAKALQGNLSVLSFSEDLENKLIHFTHARKLRKEEQKNQIHQVKSSKDYITLLQQTSKNNLISDCYSELCQITHPSAKSVVCFLVDNDESTVLLSGKNDAFLIENLAQSYAAIFPDMFIFGINPSILLLKTLNLFEYEQVQTPVANQVNTEQIPAWQKIIAKVESVKNSR